MVERVLSLVWESLFYYCMIRTNQMRFSVTLNPFGYSISWNKYITMLNLAFLTSCIINHSRTKKEVFSYYYQFVITQYSYFFDISKNPIWIFLNTICRFIFTIKIFLTLDSETINHFETLRKLFVFMIISNFSISWYIFLQVSQYYISVTEYKLNITTHYFHIYLYSLFYALGNIEPG